VSTQSPPEILIAGGGIGGVAAGLALAIRGLRVRIFEKASDFGEIGYGIQLGPNAWRMLDWLGVMQQIDLHSVHTDHLVLMDALSDRELTRMTTGPKFTTRYRAPYTVVHRPDLHGALLDACRKREEVALQTSKELVDFSDLGDRVIAKFSDGSEHEGTALIGADGLRSRVREIVMNDGAPRVSGHVSYRGVVPVDDVKDRTHWNDMVIWAGPNLHLVQYRLRGGTVMNNVATISSQRFKRGFADWGGVDELLEVFSRTTAHVQEMLGYVGKDKSWILHDREPKPGWTRGNVSLLGDAAHPTLQYLAQGARMAIEDAVVLAAKLAKSGGNTRAALTAYEKDRYLRTARVPITSRIFGEILHCDGGARDVRNHLLSQRDPNNCWEADWLYRGIEIEA
jgi:2-polyprenyl-6-methoxyphenol hydroxylase-like FAD-dependent oxidoreductase